MNNKKRVVIPKKTIDKIVSLHNQIIGQRKKTIRVIIEEGYYLDWVKKEVGHGKFEKWVEKHTPIKPRHALNYRNIYEWRVAVLGAFIVESATVADLEFTWRWANKIIEEAKKYSSQREFLNIFKWAKTRPEEVRVLMKNRFEYEWDSRWPVFYMKDGVIKVKHKKEKNKWKRHELYNAYDDKVWIKHALPIIRRRYFEKYPLEFKKRIYYEDLLKEHDLDSKYFEGEEIKQYIRENYQDTSTDDDTDDDYIEGDYEKPAAKSTKTYHIKEAANVLKPKLNSSVKEFLQDTAKKLAAAADEIDLELVRLPKPDAGYTSEKYPVYSELSQSLALDCLKIGLYGMFAQEDAFSGDDAMKWQKRILRKIDMREELNALGMVIRDITALSVEEQIDHLIEHDR